MKHNDNKLLKTHDNYLKYLTIKTNQWTLMKIDEHPYKPLTIHDNL